MREGVNGPSSSTLRKMLGGSSEPNRVWSAAGGTRGRDCGWEGGRGLEGDSLGRMAWSGSSILKKSARIVGLCFAKNALCTKR